MQLVTNYFQSCELLKAGLPKESADYFYFKDSEFNKNKKRQEPAFPYVPCWSVAALWQYLYEHNCDMAFTFDTEQSTYELVEGLVNAAIMVRKREEE